MNANRTSQPRGHFLAFTALCSVVLLGFVALAVDIGSNAAAIAQLKTVADGAALAGARQLQSDLRMNTNFTGMATLATAASSQAITIGHANRVFGQLAVVQSSDVEIGYKQTSPPDPTDSTFSSVTGATTNSVRVTATRNGSHGGVLPAYFSKIWGASGTSVSVKSTATLEPYSVSGYTASTSNAFILPIALSQSSYNNMMQYAVPGVTIPAGYDNYSYSPSGGANGTVASGPDGVPETSVYPDNAGTGNWGTINETSR